MLRFYLLAETRAVCTFCPRIDVKRQEESRAAVYRNSMQVEIINKERTGEVATDVQPSHTHTERETKRRTHNTHTHTNTP